MQKIIVLLLAFFSFSCKSNMNHDLVEKKLDQVMTEFFGLKKKSWIIREVIESENSSIADGTKFVTFVEITDIEDFINKNRVKGESLLNDPSDHFKRLFPRSSTLSKSFKHDKCEFFAHSLKLRGTRRKAYLFICIDLEKKSAILDYAEH
jgi:hypothetical protein